MARWGLNEKQIAQELEVPPIMFDEWKANYPEVRQAIERGQKYWSELAYNSLQKLITGFEYDETIIDVDKDGEAKSVRKITRHQAPNPHAVLFQLQNDPILKMFFEDKKSY